MGIMATAYTTIDTNDIVYYSNGTTSNNAGQVGTWTTATTTTASSYNPQTWNVVYNSYDGVESYVPKEKNKSDLQSVIDDCVRELRG